MKNFLRKIMNKWNYYMDAFLHKVYPITIGKYYLKKPLENVIVLESHTDFDTNGGAIYEYLIKNGFNEKYKIIWLLWNKLDRILPPNVEAYRIYKPSFKKEKYLHTAKVISTDHMVYEKKRAEQQVFYLGHGAVSLKKPKGHINVPTNTDYYLVASDYMRCIISEIFGFESPNDKELILGFPVQDCLYQPSKQELMKVTNRKFKKTIIWMPTFRKTKNRIDSNVDYKLGIPIINSMNEYVELDKILRKNNILLIIKIHPMQVLSDIVIKDTENIKILSIAEQKERNINTYELLKDTDALISDYSSIAFDYLHLNKPIGYAVDDIDKYQLGLIVDNPCELMGGPIIMCFEELLDFIDNINNDVDEYKEKRRKIFNIIFKYHDGNSCKRLIEFWNI